MRKLISFLLNSAILCGIGYWCYTLGLIATGNMEMVDLNNRLAKEGFAIITMMCIFMLPEVLLNLGNLRSIEKKE